MKRFSIILNCVLLLLCTWQQWAIQDTKTFLNYAQESSDFWHKECAHWKIHGKGTSELNSKIIVSYDN
jgi:hypothetical protein